MNREVLIDCWPFALAVLLSVFCLLWLVRISGARLQLSRLVHLHSDQSGSVQSLSFVMTLPLFVIILMFIVQMSQLMIGRVVVEYAAFAAARSAIVWIPANMGPGLEQENRISRLVYLRDVADGQGNLYTEYEVELEGPKCDKIHFAAAMACIPICPSRNVNSPRTDPRNAAAATFIRMYHIYAPDSVNNLRIPHRIRNKLAYALNNTHLRLRIRHKDEEPKLAPWGRPPYLEEFTSNEIGWQDQILVTVEHDFAMFPGPGRLFARSSRRSSYREPDSQYASYSSPGYDRPASQSTSQPPKDRRCYVYTLSATVRLNNEGEKPVLPYIQQTYRGFPGQDYGLYDGDYDEYEQ